MACDPKIGRVAQLLVAKHGDEALAVVTGRGLGLLTVQDYQLAILWTRVAGAIHTMRPDAKPERSVWHTKVPLKELMDDPLMNVIVQDDEDRRAEVHDTLRDAKRKVQGDKPNRGYLAKCGRWDARVHRPGKPKPPGNPPDNPEPPEHTPVEEPPQPIPPPIPENPPPSPMQ
jgi:hypothetical protein